MGIVCLSAFAQTPITWEATKSEGKATLYINWYTSIPFIYRDATGQLTGIEYEMINAFREYLKSNYDVDLMLEWREPESFNQIMDLTEENKKVPNLLGISAFSLTPERQQRFKFTDTYLPDVTVMVSSKGSPIVDNYEMINRMIMEMKAVTIKGTTYESLINDLKENLNQDLDIIYIESDKSILDHIGSHEKRFGFIDLPIYLISIKNGRELVRQNLFTVKGTGYGFIMPEHSDWDIPLNEFLNDPVQQSKIKNIISSFMGEEVYNFIEGVKEKDQLGTSILTMEKELQMELLRSANMKLQKEQSFRELLIVGIILSGIFIVVIGLLFYQNLRTTRKLIHQKGQIESQQRDIQQINEQLVNRNLQMIELNEERNHLMNIFAHDLRSPLNHIIGISDLLVQQSNGMEEEDKQLLNQVADGGRRINTMITRILEDNFSEDKKYTLQKENVQINQLMLDIKDRYEAVAKKKKIELIVRPCIKERVIKTDRLLLFLVLENLLSNALKFSHANSKVCLIAYCEEEGTRFVVEDEGPGFTETDKQQMFIPFQKLSARPTAGEASTGLGLSIVKKYVNDLGGNINLESEAGKGARFSVHIEEEVIA
jgi:signal transduction histidine kinase